MDNNKKYQRNRKSDSKSIPSSEKKTIENQKTFPDYPIPNEPTIPAMPDENPDHIRPEPGVNNPVKNDPVKNDPTHIDKPPSIFNNK